MNTRSCTRLLAVCAVAAIWVGSVRADEFPKRKAGLWEVTSTVVGSPVSPGPVHQCVGEDSDQVLQQQLLLGTRHNCTKSEINREDDRTVIDQICKLNGTTITTHALLTGDLDVQYHGEIHSRYDPPMLGIREGEVIIDAKYLGPCQPGQKPGDIIMPGAGGVKFNPQDSVD